LQEQGFKDKKDLIFLPISSLTAMSLKSVIKQPEGYALCCFLEAGKEKLIGGCVLIAVAVTD